MTEDGVRKNHKAPQRKEVFDPSGCGLCGTHFSSSFRNLDTASQGRSGRICNSCHCKSYRLKRKLEGLTTDRRTAPRSSKPPAKRPHLPQQTAQAVSAFQAVQAVQAVQAEPGHQLAGSLGGSGPSTPVQQWHGSAAYRAAELPLTGDTSQVSAPSVAAAAAHCLPCPPHAGLAALQARVYEQVGASADDVAMTHHCARRAQQASPACDFRMVLGILPQVTLQLPDDPLGMLHAVSCLLEAVSNGPAEESADSEQEQAQHEAEQQEQRRRQDGAEVAVRLTLFAAAGAVPCWYESPAHSSLSLAFSPTSRAPMWTSGPDGFTLHFPHAWCPQVDLFTATHQLVATEGMAVFSTQPDPATNFQPQPQLPPPAGARQCQAGGATARLAPPPPADSPSPFAEYGTCLPVVGPAHPVRSAGAPIAGGPSPAPPAAYQPQQQPKRQLQAPGSRQAHATADPLQAPGQAAAAAAAAAAPGGSSMAPHAYPSLGGLDAGLLSPSMTAAAAAAGGPYSMTLPMPVSFVPTGSLLCPERELSLPPMVRGFSCLLDPFFLD